MFFDDLDQVGCSPQRALCDGVSSTDSISKFLALLTQVGPGELDVMQIMGGEGLCSKAAVRRRLKVGHNFDIFSGSDLRDPGEQHALKSYLATHTNRFVIVDPMCAPSWPIGHFNRAIHYDGWYRSLEDAIPLATICGMVALMQVKAGRHLFCENPHLTDLHKVHPWPLVMNYVGVIYLVIHQCMTGLRGPDDMPLEKPIGMTASHDHLLHTYDLCGVTVAIHMADAGEEAEIPRPLRFGRSTSVVELCKA